MREFSVPAQPDEPGDANLTDAIYRLGVDEPQTVLFAVPGGEGWVDVTAGEALSRIRALAGGLVNAGVEPGQRVALMSGTRLEWTLCDYAIASVGAVTVPVYETSSAEQVAWILADSEAVAAVCETDSHATTIAAVRSETPDLGAVWQIDQGGLDDLARSGAGIDAAVIDQRRATLTRSSLATVIYTSGTTGRPKGCQLTHGNCLSDLHAIVPNLPDLFGPEGSTLLFLPLAHVFARAVQIACVSSRTKMAYCGDTKRLVSDLQSFRPTFLLSVPRVFEKVYNTAKQQAGGSPTTARLFALAEATAVAWSRATTDQAGASPLLRARHALFDRLVYAKMRAAVGGNMQYAVSSGGPLGDRLGHFFRGAGITVLEAYGMTECIAVTFNWPHALRVGSVGQPVPGTTIRIGADGEVMARGPSIFTGYWHNDAGTAEAFDGEFLKTGDIGELDDRGFLWITGRKKELIVTAGGKNVAPAVLEDRLRAHALISQCMVVGDDRPFIAALVTLDEDAFGPWSAEHGKSAAVADMVDDRDLRAEIQRAVDDANLAVSKAESIRSFTILGRDFTEESGEITPTLKLKRTIVGKNRTADIDALYGP
ncbi:MAG: AMP-dependent synthetase/ligase [Acidimicrobiales bacterium]